MTSARIADRRQFLATAIGAAATSVVGGGLLRAAAAQSTAPLTDVPLRDGLSVITGAGSNVVLLRAAAAAALVDSGPPEHAAELAKLVQGKLGGLPVEPLFNTHWHPDAHRRQRNAARCRYDDRRARAHAPVDEHRVLRRLGRPHVHAARRGGIADENVLRNRSAAALAANRRRANRVRASARGPHRRRRLCAVQAAQRARDGRRRDVRRVSRPRLHDGRLDRRSRRGHEEAARHQQRRHVDRARSTGPRNRDRISRRSSRC